MKKNSLFLPLFILFSFQSICAQEINNVQQDTLKALSLKSYLAYDKGDYSDVVQFSSALINKANEYNNKYYEFIGYDSQASIYGILEDSINARVYAEKALNIAIESKADSLISWGYLNLGIIFTENKLTYKKGIDYLKQSLDIYIKQKSNKDILLLYINLAWTYLDNNRNDEAYAVLIKMAFLTKKIEITEDDKAYIHFLFGKYYFNKQHYKLSEQELLASSAIIDRDSLVMLGTDTYDLLATLYAHKELYKKAFESLEKYNFYNKKVYAENRIKEFEKSSTKFNLSEYQKNLDAALEQKKLSEELFNKTNELKSIFTIASIILFIALLGFFLLFKARKKYISRLRNKNIELLHAKEKAEKLSKVKTQFFSTVSHELRTPLYGVIGITSILQEDKLLIEHHEQDLNALKFSADYLLSLINDVLLLSKMDSESIKLNKNSFQLNTLIAGIINSFQFSLEENKNKLIVNVDQAIPNFLIGDSVRLSQILINLIGNAIKFNSNGSIWLDIELKDRGKTDLCTLFFTIKDNGIGIPKDKQKDIFKEFSQVVNDNYTNKGTGLGLPIVKRLLKLYQSDINLKSELGKGSEFSFTLELLEDKNANEEELNTKHFLEDINNAIILQYRETHILVVDDNKINLKVTERMLTKNGIQSSLAHDGEEAIAMVKENTYDLILMDINMPKIDGIEATKIIRTFNKDIPIVALTAVELEEMGTEIFDSGMNAILSKPYDKSQFLSTIISNLKNNSVKNNSI